MYFTVSVKDVGIILLLLVFIILGVYLIQFFRNLIVTVKSSNEILEDVNVMTKIAKKRTEDLDNAIGNVSESVESITNAIKGHESILKQLSTIGAAISSIVGIFNKNKED